MGVFPISGYNHWIFPKFCRELHMTITKNVTRQSNSLSTEPTLQDYVNNPYSRKKRLSKEGSNGQPMLAVASFDSWRRWFTYIFFYYLLQKPWPPDLNLNDLLSLCFKFYRNCFVFMLNKLSWMILNKRIYLQFNRWHAFRIFLESWPLVEECLCWFSLCDEKGSIVQIIP